MKFIMENQLEDGSVGARLVYERSNTLLPNWELLCMCIIVCNLVSYRKSSYCGSEGRIIVASVPHIGNSRISIASAGPDGWGPLQVRPDQQEWLRCPPCPCAQ